MTRDFKFNQFRVGRFVNEYISVCEEMYMDDSEIIDKLLEFFSDDELRGMGFGNYIKEYMED